MFKIRWGILLVFFLFGTASYSQFLNRQKNQYDENGKRKGLWITYWDEEDKVPMSVATYKNGYKSDVSKEYHQNGNLRLKFRYHKHRMRVKYYNENWNLERKGWSVIEYNKADTHYYWHGKWKYYDDNRRLIRIDYYLNGKEISTE